MEAPLAKDFASSHLFFKPESLGLTAAELEACKSLQRDFSALVAQVDPLQPWRTPNAERHTTIPLARFPLEWLCRVGGSGGFEPWEAQTPGCLRLNRPVQAIVQDSHGGLPGGQQRGASTGRQLVIDDLVAYWGPEAAKPLELVEHNWNKAPWSGGAFTSFVIPGTWTGPARLATANHGFRGGNRSRRASGGHSQLAVLAQKGDCALKLLSEAVDLLRGGSEAQAGSG